MKNRKIIIIVFSFKTQFVFQRKMENHFSLWKLNKKYFYITWHVLYKIFLRYVGSLSLRQPQPLTVQLLHNIYVYQYVRVGMWMIKNRENHKGKYSIKWKREF